MFILMAISLYTSRIILQVLGVEDFGIYNVVGGIISMMGVVNTAMSVSAQRYLTFELGKNDFQRLKQVFSVCVTIYFLLSLLFLVLAETVGLWFLNNKLIIPEDRIVTANWVYQFSIFAAIFALMTNPYNAVIISREKMGVYAYLSIFESVMKLTVVFLLLAISFDRLKTYGALMLMVQILTSAFYIIYCNINYKESVYKFYWERSLFSNLVAYTGWNLFGAFSGVAKGQGLNILLNMFFGTAVNAARGLAYQVNNAISHFFTNFYIAVRPQITKYYAQGDQDNMLKLVFRSSKMSFFLILLVSLPIMIEAPYIIQLWLGQTPEYVVPFMRVIIVISAIDAMAQPLMTTAHATGKIALYQSVVGTMTMLNIPISYVFLSLGFGPIVVFRISLVISLVNLFLRLWIVKRLVNFPVSDYIMNVFAKCFLIAVLSSVVPLLIHEYTRQSTLSFLMVVLFSLLSATTMIWLIGLTANERTGLLMFAKNKLNR